MQHSSQEDENEFAFKTSQFENFDSNETTLEKLSEPSNNSAYKSHSFSRRTTSQNLLDSNSDDDVQLIGSSHRDYFTSPELQLKMPPSNFAEGALQQKPISINRAPSAGPSRRQSSVRVKSPKPREKQERTSSFSDSDESDEMGVMKQKKTTILGEYDPAQYEHLEVSEEIKEIFQYIIKYVPQQLNLDFKFKPFIPDFMPAVGDIDAFLKVIPPDTTLSGESFNSTESQLGLTVLDEPTANQSDPALLHLQLRAASISTSYNSQTMVVKKVDNVEKNSKVVDKWIKNVADLHRNRSASTIRYSKKMPDIEQLMQEWPEEFESAIKDHGIPNPQFCGTFSQYIDVLCAIFDIPVNKNRIESLHLLFSLYAAIKNSRFYENSNAFDDKDNTETGLLNNKSDHLVLD